jgi:hypothetical protein
MHSVNAGKSRKPMRKTFKLTQFNSCQEVKLSELTDFAPFQIRNRHSALKPGASANYHFQRWSLATLLTST